MGSWALQAFIFIIKRYREPDLTAYCLEVLNACRFADTDTYTFMA
jgi:hypothetical protein